MIGKGMDRKASTSILHVPERKFIDWAVPKVPQWLKSRHLTLLTIPECIGILGFGYLAQTNINWLWGVSVCIALQWLTDSLDGSVGRTRGEGLVKWGFYMDHFLDYIFLLSILISYAMILPQPFVGIQFFVLAALSAFMVNSFLDFGATNEFRISYMGIGPTEIRIFFIILNTLHITLGKTFMAFLLPYGLVASFVGLCWVVYKTQKHIYELDMQELAKQKRKKRTKKS